MLFLGESGEFPNLIKAPVKRTQHLVESRCWGRLTPPLNNVERCWDMLRRVWFRLNFVSTSSQHLFCSRNVEAVWHALSTLFSVPDLTHLSCWAFVERLLRPFDTAWSKHLSTCLNKCWENELNQSENRQFPSSFALFQSEYWCKAFHMKLSSTHKLIFMRNKHIFRLKGFTPSLVLNERQKVTRNWPVYCTSTHKRNESVSVSFTPCNLATLLTKTAASVKFRMHCIVVGRN